MWDNFKRDFPVRGCFEKVHRQDPLFCFDASISLLCGYIYSFFPCGSEVKASACNVGDLGSISGSGKLPGEGNGNPRQYSCWRIPWTEEPDRLQPMLNSIQFHTKVCNSKYAWGASLVAQRLKHLPAMWEIRVQSLGWEDSLEKGKATHSSILAWRIPWTVESMGSH